MLFSPEAHEALADEPWSAARIRAAIAAIAADAESAFDDGWTMHPGDVEDGDDPAARLRTVYLGGAGVVDALHRRAQRGFTILAGRELGLDVTASVELTWRAGPLGKGANLCHRTAGNGYAFLALLARTGRTVAHPGTRVRDARRRSGGAQPVGARARAPHAWTGDPGTALYLADCTDGVGKLPLPRLSDEPRLD